MRTRTYRLIVVGSVLSSFLVGLHVPMLHEIIDHGARPRWEVLIATLLLVVSTIAGTWVLLHTPGPSDRAGR